VLGDQQSKQLVFKAAFMGERFTLLYKYVLNFLDNDVSIADIVDAMKVRRRRSGMRSCACGLYVRGQM
jgi:phosphoribosyl-ATP pyrophosphohydrolase